MILYPVYGSDKWNNLHVFQAEDLANNKREQNNTKAFSLTGRVKNYTSDFWFSSELE